MNALTDSRVGELANKYFVATFQRVGTFKITGKQREGAKIGKGQKQGGNVATYLLAPDGRVINAIAGPVDARTMRDELEWTIQKTREAIKDSKGNAGKFKALLRTYHAELLRDKYGAHVTPILKDGTTQTLETALAYRDKDGRKLAPVLPLPPIENGKVRLSNIAKTHQLLAAHAGAKIEDLYGAVFEGILNEKVTTKPVKGAPTWRKELKTR